MKKSTRENIHSFTLEVESQLISSDQQKEKPLLIYLHGFNQNTDDFRAKTSTLQEIDAHHLFIEGPYPLYNRRRKKKVKNWGRAWYLYDGEPEQFAYSLEKTSTFIDEVLQDILAEINTSRLALIGYSMGAYMAGYYALSRPKRIRELVVIGGRVKTELFLQNSTYQELQVLALHGARDKTVSSDHQRKSVKKLAEAGAEVTFKEIDATHSLTTLFIEESKRWFLSHGNNYREDKD